MRVKKTVDNAFSRMMMPVNTSRRMMACCLYVRFLFSGVFLLNDLFSFYHFLLSSDVAAHKRKITISEKK